MTAHERLKYFMEITGYFTQKAVAGLIGVSSFSLARYLNEPGKHPVTEYAVIRFLEKEAIELTDIHFSLRSKKNNRIALHRRRSEILKKVKVHTS